MASSSASASTSQFPRWNYDVFLSFRGEDTRKTFTSHLYEILDIRGIKTFQDDKRLEHGASISDELCKAIEESQCAVIIFSKNYATSRWCLNELVKIMDCKTQFGQTVIPVFYDVDPSHVRYQRESFAEAFSKHETKYKDNVEGMQRWRITLTAAANLKGCDIRDKYTVVRLIQGASTEAAGNLTVKLGKSWPSPCHFLTSGERAIREVWGRYAKDQIIEIADLKRLRKGTSAT